MFSGFKYWKAVCFDEDVSLMLSRRMDCCKVERSSGGANIN